MTEEQPQKLIQLNQPETITLTRFEPDGACQSILEVKNIHKKNVAFKIKTTEPKIFTVKPTTGVVPPGMSQICKVQLLVTETPDGDVMKNKFKIQMAETDLRPNEVSEIVTLLIFHIGVHELRLLGLHEEAAARKNPVRCPKDTNCRRFPVQEKIIEGPVFHEVLCRRVDDEQGL